jgi:hypothetical protein
MESIGIDVHQVNSQICVVGENAEVLEERRIQTDRERFAAVLGSGRRRECCSRRRRRANGSRGAWRSLGMR